MNTTKIQQKATSEVTIAEKRVEELKRKRKDAQSELGAAEMELIMERYKGFFKAVREDVAKMDIPRKDFAKFLRVLRFTAIDALFQNSPPAEHKGVNDETY